MTRTAIQAIQMNHNKKVLKLKTAQIPWRTLLTMQMTNSIQAMMTENVGSAKAKIIR